MYLSLGVGVGGHCFDDRSDNTKPWINDDRTAQRNFYRATDTWKRSWGDHSALLVDYVHIWAL